MREISRSAMMATLFAVTWPCRSGSAAALVRQVVDGQASAVYREQYQSKTGSTEAQIWISKTSGLVLREEKDGDVTGKGKGHIAYRWTSAGPVRAAAPAAQSNGKVPMYPRGRKLNDMPASAVAMGVPMELAARLQAAIKSAKPVLLRADYDASHTGFAASKRQAELNTADMIAVAVWQIGDPDFQPKVATTDQQ